MIEIWEYNDLLTEIDFRGDPVSSPKLVFPILARLPKGKWINLLLLLEFAGDDDDDDGDDQDDDDDFDDDDLGKAPQRKVNKPAFTWICCCCWGWWLKFLMVGDFTNGLTHLVDVLVVVQVWTLSLQSYCNLSWLFGTGSSSIQSHFRIQLLAIFALFKQEIFDALCRVRLYHINTKSWLPSFCFWPNLLGRHLFSQGVTTLSSASRLKISIILENSPGFPQCCTLVFRAVGVFGCSLVFLGIGVRWCYLSFLGVGVFQCSLVLVGIGCSLVLVGVGVTLCCN